MSKIDIQMPLIKGGFIVGAVLVRLLKQDVACNFYVETGDDLKFTSDQERLLQRISTSPEHIREIKKSTRVAAKLNRLRQRGNSAYVYLADADVLLPPPPVFGSMVHALETYSELGAVGLSYQNNAHLACGSMMLRRIDRQQVGEIKGTSVLCVCNYIQKQLAGYGLRSVLLRKTVSATHLNKEYQKGYPEYHEVRYKAPSDGLLSRSFLDETVGRYGTRFRLYIDES